MVGLSRKFPPGCASSTTISWAVAMTNSVGPDRRRLTPARRRAEARRVQPSGGTLVAMNDNAQRPGHGADGNSAVDDPSDRLAAYEARTEKALDLRAA